MYVIAHMEVREQLERVSSFLPPCGSPEQNLGYHTWWQTPLPADPSHYIIFIDKLNIH